MKKLSLLLTFFLCLSFTAFGQIKSYWTNGGELIFSWADYKDSAGKDYKSPPRVSLFFHLNYKHNIDFGKYVGVAYGIGMRNIGFFAKEEKGFTKITRRSYTLGVPVMLKLGNLGKNRFLAIGAEYEWLFRYKEKHFQGRDKVAKIVGWRSERTNEFLPSVFVGYQFSKNWMLKFQYYLDDFMNSDYQETDANGNVFRPYSGQSTSRVMFISILGNANLTERYKELKEKREKKKKEEPAKAFKNQSRATVNY